jgi:serine/threonine-protein kinase
MRRRGAADGGAIDPAATQTATTSPEPPAATPPDVPLGLAQTVPTPLPEHAPGTLSASPARAPRLEAAGADLATTGIQGVPPSILERYEILSHLGSGGMGAVYRALDRRLQRVVALKVLLRQGVDGGKRMLREARAQARLDHENVCKVFEAADEDGVCHIAMAYIDGEPFGVACAGMVIEEKVRIALQVAWALHEAHRHGLVHRDVKPSNIMVEEREDGARKPYLVDFGIAREMGDEGQTATGAVVGTPQFMAPEQARGEIHALDRRTDVYSLGATLYAVLAGRPPFTAPSAWGLLRMIMNDDAPPLRRVRPEVPADLEAIVAKCLEKAPRRRYDSAKALAEDLQRYLDGDPVRARRLSPGYVLLRKARKHKAAVALAGAVLVAALIVSGLWIRERRVAAARADVARELGEDVKEMELFLRAAYELPLHDVEREKDVVRARLGGIEARMAAIGRAGEGPGHYALGRGHLALQEPEEARAHLEKASAAGYASPELDYALGLALGDLHEQAIEEAKRIDNPERQKARLDAIKKEYEEPALRHLRASLGARLDAPAYVEGLIALHEGKPEEALAKAQEASAARPWLYEAKKLEGDARFAVGNRYRADAAFDYDRMTVEFRAAAEAYASAGEIARSDPRVHTAACVLGGQIMNAAAMRSEPLRPSHDQARAACDRAIGASSRGDRAPLELAFVQVSYAWLAVTGLADAEPEAVLAEAITLAEEAMRRSPRDPMAPYVVAEARRTQARWLEDRGLDARSTIDRAVASYEQALGLDPTFLWALNDLGTAYVDRAAIEISQGLDPTASLRAAVEHSRRASQLDKGFLNAYAHESVAHLVTAEYLVDTGRDPAPAIVPWRRALEAGRALSRDWSAGDYLGAYQGWLEARYVLDSGGDPSAALEEAVRSGGEELRRSPPAGPSNMLAGELASTRARYLLAQGRDPVSALREAREAFQRGLEAAPKDLAWRVARARAEIVGLHWAATLHALAAESFQAARAPLSPMLDRPRVAPDLYETLAEIDEIEAAWLLDRSKSAGEVLAHGLAMAMKALAINPRMPRAHATQGALLLLEARSAGEPEARREAARRGEEALSAAVRENPLLARELAPLLRRAAP